MIDKYLGLTIKVAEQHPDLITPNNTGQLRKLHSLLDKGFTEGDILKALSGSKTFGEAIEELEREVE